jgi:hypothetical protein
VPWRESLAFATKAATVIIIIITKAATVSPLAAIPLQSCAVTYNCPHNTHIDS